MFRKLFCGNLSLSPLCLSFLRSSDRAERVDSDDPSDRTAGETSLGNLLVRVDDEVGRMDDTASRFPVGPDLIGVFRDFKAITDWKCRAGFDNHFLGLVQWIHRQRDHVGVF